VPSVLDKRIAQKLHLAGEKEQLSVFTKEVESERAVAHNLGSDSEVEAGSRARVMTDQKCETHNVGLVLVPGPYGHFLGCPRYPSCDVRRSIRFREKVGTDVKCRGKDGVACDEPMFAVRGRHGVYLKCFNPNCEATRRIAS
jgi:ssDNA-binding Zn-finger/Zn-ribbon topoisomerase 1